MVPRPQRVAPPAKPGTLVKGQHGRPELAARAAERAKAPSHLAAIRECPCLNCGLDPAGEAAHLRRQSGAHGKAGGMGRKPADRWALPLCRSCHAEQHKLGEREFWAAVDIEPFLAAAMLWTATGNVPRMRALAFLSITSRNGGQA